MNAGAPQDPKVEAQLELLPQQPGCYLFADESAKILYVGKAKSLRSRVRSYFQSSGSDARYFIPLLRAMVRDIQTVITQTEKEAAVLENELIKQYQPRFNVKLRDDKDFLCLRLDARAKWPRLETVRRPLADGAQYFGPYHSATSARKTLHLCNKHFQLRTCSDADFASRKRPCLQHQIKRCDAPCVLEVDRKAYGAQVSAVSLFLEGRHDELTASLSEWMTEASGDLEFERAAIYRDQLRSIESIRENQRIVTVSDADQDVLGLYREGTNVEIEVLFVRRGRISDTANYSLRKIELPDEEVIGNFLSAFYGDGHPIPKEVLLPCLPDGVDGIAEWMSEKRGARTTLLGPQRGQKKQLLAMAEENARNAFRSKLRASEDMEMQLADLQARLSLPELPRRIECCDISHLGGGDTVGSVVALSDGQPDKKRYRSFHVETVEGGDDYGAMAEVLSRRFRRGLAARSQAEALASSDGPNAEPKGTPSPWELPQLFVVDGGRGQLGVALAAARDLGLHDLAIVGLAKERESVKGEKVVDRVYLPGQKNGIALRPGSSLFLLARARDEAHRFANHARKKLGKSRQLRSPLDDVKGLPRAVKIALTHRFGRAADVLTQTAESLLEVPGVSNRHVRAIEEHRTTLQSVEAPPCTPEAADRL